MPIIYGFLERITYYNEENDFVVAKLQEKGKKELTTIVGNLSGINAGESLKLSGRWVHNKKFGEQFQVETFEAHITSTSWISPIKTINFTNASECHKLEKTFREDIHGSD